MEKTNLCVIIPVHKPVPTADEVVSLRACKKQLNKYDCFLVYPEGMAVNAYTAIHDGLKLMPVNAAWLSSVEHYNKMKLNLNFYQLFATYQHMLTYELDAYIFNPDIEATDALTFDFIGAPFFEGYWAATPHSPFIPGCNSGFSIRNIQSCIQVLQGMKKYRFHWLLYKLFLSPVRPLRLWLNKITKEKYEVFITGRFAFYFAGFHLNEDVVWAEVVPQLFPSFKVADPMSALKFSFEYNLDKSLELNGGNLPLGCHAWYKNLDFWEKYIN
jgi:hypothetical protein